ncbi:hypothetical protein Hanom_Chr15g01364141 [Helianthus anomalus]
MRTSWSVRALPKVVKMTMRGLFIGFPKRKGLADQPGIPIGQPARSAGSLIDP